MKGSTKIRLGLASVAVGAAAIAALPATASTGYANITGTGTISPGLGTAPAFHSFTFSGTGAVATAEVQGTFSCNVTGTDPAGTVASGSGGFSGSCSTSSGSSSVSGTFSRNGGAVTISGNASGPVSGHFTGACSFTPTSAAVDSYAVHCHFAIGV